MFLISISLVTLVVTGSCMRVLGEYYHESVIKEEEEKGSEYDGDDDAFWNTYNGEGHSSGDGDDIMRSYTQPFHYQVAIQTLSSLPIEVALGIFCLLCAWSLTSLTCFHGLIITLNQTTNERVRGVYQYGGIGNPADEGCWSNWKGACCNRVPESKLPHDFSEEVILPGITVSNDRREGDENEECSNEKSNVEEPKATPEQSYQPVVEETVWPGWQYSHSFTSLINAAPPSGPTRDQNRS